MTKSRHVNKPSARVANAMARLSHNRWLNPKDVCRIGYSFARCSSPNHWTVFDAAIAPECMTVGMIRGQPPAFVGERNYSEILFGLKRSWKQMSDTEIFIAILRITKPPIYKELK